jgi:hypothetical protein
LSVDELRAVYRLADSQKTSRLLPRLVLYVGQWVSITHNNEQRLGVVNGAVGRVVGWSAPSSSGTFPVTGSTSRVVDAQWVRLSRVEHTPTIYIQLQYGGTHRFEALNERVVPIEVLPTKMALQLDGANGRVVQRLSIRQIPLVPAISITGHKSQGVMRLFVCQQSPCFRLYFYIVLVFRRRL